MTNSSGAQSASLNDRLGVRGGIVLGLVAMIGAGLFSSFAPAAATAGPRLFASVIVAAVVAGAGALSLLRLDAHQPSAHGVYVQGRELLGLPWGHLAGWAFLVGKGAACAAAALTIGAHLWPALGKPTAVFVVLCVLVLALQGIHRSPRLAAGLVGVTILLVVIFGIVMLASPPVTADAPPPARPGSGTPLGVLQGAGFLVFAFIGYSRLSALRVEDGRGRRDVRVGLGVAVLLALALYLLVVTALTDTLGSGWVAARKAPLAEAAEISSWPWLGPALRITCVLLVGGVLLALLAATSSMVVRMAQDRHLPPSLAHVDGPGLTPRRADAVVAGLVIILIVLLDLHTTIAIASFCALVHLGIAHAAAWRLGGPARIVAALGLLAALVVAVLLPWPAVVLGGGVLAVGAFVGWARWTTRDGRTHP